MRRIAWPALIALVFVTPAFLPAQQNTVDDKSKEVSKPAVDAMRALASTIKGCPAELVFERKRQKDSTVIGSFLMGPPMNVIWDIGPNKSVRAPYTGYLEFTISVRVSRSPNATEKEAASLEQERQLWPPPTRYRYEFDIGTSGLELMRSLSRTLNETDWKEQEFSGMGRCWGKAVHNSQAKQDKDKPPQ